MMMKFVTAGIALAAAVTLVACSPIPSASAPAASDTPDVVYPDGTGPGEAGTPGEPAEQQTPEAGSLEQPFPKGYTATITQGGEDYYTATFSLVEANGDKRIAAANQFNDKAPSGYHYVIVQGTFTGLSSEAVHPGAEMYRWQIADQDGNLYQAASVVTDEESLSGAPDLYKGQKFTGVEVYAVPNSVTALYMSAFGSYMAL